MSKHNDPTAIDRSMSDTPVRRMMGQFGATFHSSEAAKRGRHLDDHDERDDCGKWGCTPTTNAEPHGLSHTAGPVLALIDSVLGPDDGTAHRYHMESQLRTGAVSLDASIASLRADHVRLLAAVAVTADRIRWSTMLLSAWDAAPDQETVETLRAGIADCVEDNDAALDQARTILKSTSSPDSE